MNGTETLLLSLDRETAGQRLLLRRAYLTGRPVRTALIKRSRPVRVVDYAETFHDDSIEIAVSVADVPDEPVGESH